MTKLKRLRFVLLTSTILLAGVVLVFVSCAPAAVPPALPKPEPERTPSVVAVIPNVGKAGEKINYVGANFEPGEKVVVCVLCAPGIENTIYRPTVKLEEELSLGIEVDELGSFGVNNKIPAQLTPGVYPVRVYNEEREMLASTVLLVVE